MKTIAYPKTTGLGRKPGMKAFSHYDGADYLLRIIDDTGEEWDEYLAGWDLILDLTTGRSFWRHRYDGREIDSAYDFWTQPVITSTTTYTNGA